MAYRKSSLTNTYTTAVTTKQVATKTLFPVFNRVNSIIINKDGLTKENARIRQVLKETEHQESIIKKIIKKITNNHSMSHSEQTQAIDIQEKKYKLYKFTQKDRNINLLCVEGISEKQRHKVDLKKEDSIFTLKGLCVNCFRNEKLGGCRV